MAIVHPPKPAAALVPLPTPATCSTLAMHIESAPATSLRSGPLPLSPAVLRPPSVRHTSCRRLQQPSAPAPLWDGTHLRRRSPTPLNIFSQLPSSHRPILTAHNPPSSISYLIRNLLLFIPMPLFGGTFIPNGRQLATHISPPVNFLKGKST